MKYIVRMDVKIIVEANEPADAAELAMDELSSGTIENLVVEEA